MCRVLRAGLGVFLALGLACCLLGGVVLAAFWITGTLGTLTEARPCACRSAGEFCPGGCPCGCAPRLPSSKKTLR